MERSFFYISAVVVWILFIICIRFRRPDIRHIVTGITTVAYAVIFDTLLGGQLGLYYYISPRVSLLYIILAAACIYAPLNVIYTLFIPKGKPSILAYTGMWMVGMLIFEYFSLIFGTVVFTGWQPVPWSLVAYVVTYAFTYFVYKTVDGRCPVRE